MPEIDITKRSAPIVFIDIDEVCSYKERIYYTKNQTINCPSIQGQGVSGYCTLPEGGSCCEEAPPPNSGLYIYWDQDKNQWEWKTRLEGFTVTHRDSVFEGDLPPSRWGSTSFGETQTGFGQPSLVVNYRYRTFTFGAYRTFIITEDTPSICRYMSITKKMTVAYNKIKDIQLIVDGAKLAQLIVDNNPDPDNYTFAGFYFYGNDTSLGSELNSKLDNYTLVSPGYGPNEFKFSTLFEIAWKAGSSVSSTFRIHPGVVNVANPDCGKYDFYECGLKVTELSYTAPDVKYIGLTYIPKELTQKEEPLKCNKCEGLKTIITDTGDQTQICSPITCSTDSDCPEGCMCVDGECQPIISCSSDNDCPEGQVCVNGKCVDEEEQKEDEQDISSDFSIGVNHIIYEDDALDILYIPSNLAVYDAKGTYIGDAPYDQIDGIVVSTNGVFYYPHVRISRISDSFSEAGIMEFTQYAKFDDTPYFKEGQLVYGVLYGQVLFGGFINDISYTISEGEQLIKYTAVSFRKDFEEAPWVFNYRDYDITTTTVLSKIINAAPRLFCRGRSGSLPKQTISEVNFTNQTIGEGLSYLFSAAGTYAWHLGPDKIFRIYNLRNLPIENIYVAQEGNNLSDHSEYKVVSMELNYNLSDRITRLIIRGDFKRDKNNNIIEDSKGNPTYLIYDTGWKGTAYTQFNIQHTKTLIESRFKYIEGQRDDTPYMKQYANLYLKPLQDAYIGGSITLEGILTNFSVGKAVKIYNTNLSYLNNQTLVIMDVEYDLDNKITRLSLSSNYWFGTDITKYFATIEERVNAIDRKAKALEETKGELQIAAGKITQILSGNLFLEGRLIKISSDVRTISIHPATPGCSYYNVGGFNQLKVGDYIQVHYRKVSYNSPYLSFPYNKAFKIFKIT